jgi:hypothetical protein
MTNKLQREPISRPGEPTDAAPGSPRKIRVLTERAARREPLFHPQDNLKRRPPIPAELLPEAVPELEEVSEPTEEMEEMEEVEALEADLAS